MDIPETVIPPFPNQRPFGLGNMFDQGVGAGNSELAGGRTGRANRKKKEVQRKRIRYNSAGKRGSNRSLFDDGGLDMGEDSSGSSLSSDDLATYRDVSGEIPLDDINGNDNVSLFKIITVRYFRSAYPSFFKRKVE